MKFVGIVQFRSSVNPGSGPPGEAEVLSLNPQRRDRILEATRWAHLEPGSLNLTVDNAVVEGLWKLTPALIEDASTVRYPDRYKHIPIMRRAYHYYRGVVTAKGKTLEVLVRRAEVPVAGRVELFAPVNLKSLLELSLGAHVLVEMAKFN